MRSEEEIRKAVNLLLNDVLNQIDQGGRPRESKTTVKIRTLRWVLGEIHGELK